MLLVVLGLANVAIAAVAQLTTRVRLDGQTTLLLALLGLATMALGAFVWRGRKWAILAAVVVFSALFAIQAFAASGGAPAPATITLAVILLPLVLALRATNREP